MSSEARDKIIRYYRAQNQEEIATRLVDYAEVAQKSGKVKVTDFLDPAGLQILETIGAHYPDLRILTDGGFMKPERVKAAFVFKEFQGNVSFQLGALEVLWDKRFIQLGHRDVLGAIMAIGLKREVYGDIVMTPKGCQLVLDQTLVPLVLAQLNQIGPNRVEIKEISLSDLIQKEEKVKEIRTTVPSLRLDVVAAAGFGVSRSKLAAEIKADKIRVNWQEIHKADQPVKAGDIISARGRGRVEICEVLGATKKGRISLLLKRIL